MTPPLHVFVVMPYGIRSLEDGRRLAFNAAYAELLKPAIERAGCVAFRADEEAAAGDIRTDMFYELVTADVVVADTSMHNVNVFYEIGVRHMATPRGAILVGALETKSPFDTGPDRRILYDASPWLVNAKGERAPTDPAALESIVAALAERLRAAIAAQPSRKASPIFAHLDGLRPVDPSSITAGEAVSLGMQLEQLHSRIADARAQGRAGDIVTIAQTAPTSNLRRQLMRRAARELIDMRQYSGALRVLDQHRADVPGDVEMESLRGLVLNRLGEGAKAKAALEQLWATNATNAETAGMLGRVFKDRWRASFEAIDGQAERLQRAGAPEAVRDAERSFRCYVEAARANLNKYYVGINAIAMGRLLRHVAKRSNSATTIVDDHELADLCAAVRCALVHETRRVAAPPLDRGSDAVWCHATRGELALLGDDPSGAERCYVDAVRAEPKPFEIESMLSQLRLYELLDWHPTETRACIAHLEPLRRAASATFARVAVCSGHMIDQPTRPTPRFPPSSEPFVRERIAATMQEWNLGPGDLAVCGGARGADLLFAEEAMRRGARVQLYIAQPLTQFRPASLHLGASDFSWAERFDALRRRGAEVFDRAELLGNPPIGVSIYEQTNRWILNAAMTLSSGTILGLLVWDGKDAGDGPGGTAHFQRELLALNCTPRVIHPLSVAAASH